jgi:hypothetical protein
MESLGGSALAFSNPSTVSNAEPGIPPLPADIACNSRRKLVYELRITLSGLESQLNPKQFVRIHRSTLVNVSMVKEIHPWFNGHHKVILLDGKELRMSRYQSESARLLLGRLGK